MLRDGKFIKEPPIKIGAHYVPSIYREQSEEERLIQRVILDEKPKKHHLTFMEVGMFMVVVFTAAWMIASLFKFIVDVLLG
jgi:hypothetical protein